MAGALSRLRVLDLSRVLAGPWAAQILADLGAEVIKVERPGAATTRAAGARRSSKDARRAATPATRPTSCAANRGKKSVTLDIATPEGQALVRELARRLRRAARELQGRRPRALRARLRRRLSALNPRLVYCSITGFGQTGPVPRPRRLRLHDPGHGRPHEHHRRARRPARRRPAESRRRDRRPDDRHVLDRRHPGGAASTATRAGAGSTSTWRCSTRRSRGSPTRR